MVLTLSLSGSTCARDFSLKGLKVASGRRELSRFSESIGQKDCGVVAKEEKKKKTSGKKEKTHSGAASKDLRAAPGSAAAADERVPEKGDPSVTGGSHDGAKCSTGCSQDRGSWDVAASASTSASDSERESPVESGSTTIGDGERRLGSLPGGSQPGDALLGSLLDLDVAGGGAAPTPVPRGLFPALPAPAAPSRPVLAARVVAPPVRNASSGATGQDLMDFDILGPPATQIEVAPPVATISLEAQPAARSAPTPAAASEQPVALAPQPDVDRFAALGEVKAEDHASIMLGALQGRSAAFGELLSAVLGEQR
jgi:hypothetical protein